MMVPGCGNTTTLQDSLFAKDVYRQLDFPYAVSTIAAMLLHYRALPVASRKGSS